MSDPSPIMPEVRSDECEHTEHAQRGAWRMGRAFAGMTDNTGHWERCELPPESDEREQVQ